MRYYFMLALLLCQYQIYAESSAELAERFAIADDRAAVVASLVPGTDEHFYYQCLLWQHQGKLADVDAILQRWETLHPVSAIRMRIVARQAVLWFDVDQAKGAQQLAHVAEFDFLQLRHAVVPGVVHDQQLPSIFDATKLTWDAQQEKNKIDPASWNTDELVQRLDTIKDPALRRKALSHIMVPIFPKAVEIIVADLVAPEGNFGSLQIHRALTVAQLDACRVAVPSLDEDEDYIRTYIKALRQRLVDVDLDHDFAARQAWVATLRTFTATLPSSAEALQMLVALHQLDGDVHRGKVTREQIVYVLSHPIPEWSAFATRISRTAKPTSESSQPNAVEKKESLQAVTGLPLVDNPQQLIRQALELWFIDAPDTSAFAGLVDETWLRHIFIETKLVHGIGDAATWLTQAGDAHIGMRLQDQVEIEFARHPPRFIAGDAPVSLPVRIKNVPALRVRMYALDAVNIYRQLGNEPSLSLDLSGVLPTHERVLVYPQTPIIRHDELLALPECATPGLWMIELIGGNQVARALLRKGRLIVRQQSFADGEHFFIYNEALELQKDAVIWQGEQLFSAAADGSIRLPYVVEKQWKSLVISAADRATVMNYEGTKENWRLSTQVMLEREQLIAGGQATALIRPSLTINGERVAFSHAKDVRIIITNTLHDNVRQVLNVIPQEDPQTGEWAVSFMVPEQLWQVDIAVQVTVHNASLNKEDVLKTSESRRANLDYWSDRIADVQLIHDDTGWSFIARGRAGEPIVGEVISFGLHHHFHDHSIYDNLATNKDGRVVLGQLPGINRITWRPTHVTKSANPESINERSLNRTREWELTQQRESPQSLIVAAGQEIRVPVSRKPLPQAGAEIRSTWHLLRGDGSSYADDVSAAMQFEQVGAATVMVAKKLPVGHYVLFTDDGSRHITVLAGTRHNNVVIGHQGIQEINSPTPLGINAATQGDGIRIQLINATATTRAHIIGLRYQPMRKIWFDENLYVGKHQAYAKAFSHYRNNQKLDAETGYILARAGAEKFPGVMLDRPGLLLNPWFDESFMAIGAGGGSAGMIGNLTGGGKRRSIASSGGSRANESVSDYMSILDYLANPGVVLANLRPDANGLITVSAEQLGDAQQVLISVCDDTSASTQLITRSPTPIKIKERRLTAPLPAHEHLVSQRLSQVVQPDKPVSVRHGALDRHRTCKTIEELFLVFQASSQYERMNEFTPLMRWPTLTEKQQYEWYSEHACHEVHLFLYHKDRLFFEKVIRPYVANKIQKTFVDQWLLEEDLTPWLAADRYRQLNLCERILLIRRLGKDAAARGSVSLQDLFKHMPDDSVALSDHIATALLSQDHVETADSAQESNLNNELKPEELPKSADANSPEANINVAINEIAEPKAHSVIQAFRDHGKTQALIEHNWYRFPINSYDVNFIDASNFWRDYANWNGADKFLSPACLLASNRVNEMLLVLAISDLPFTAKPVVWTNGDNGTRQLSVSSPTLLFTEAVVPVALQPGNVIVYQKIYQLNNLPENNRNAVPVDGPLLPGIPYVNRTVILNPTAQSVSLAMLAQIPQGAIPLYAGVTTIMEERWIPEYGHQTIDQVFYLSDVGSFSHFPTHISYADSVIAADSPVSRVVQASGTDMTSSGLPSDPKALLAYLSTARESDINFQALLWRCHEADFWNTCISIMERRLFYNDALWSFSVKHRDVERMRVWARANTNLVNVLGRDIQSGWLHIDPLVDGGIQLIEFTPLTIARAHDYPGQSNRVLQEVADHCAEFMQRLCLESTFSDRTRLELVYAMTLQNRLSEAAKQFQKIDPQKIAGKLQYNYLGAYLACARGDIQQAAAFAAVGKNHPVTHWRLRFGEVLAQLEEIGGRPAQREQALQDSQRQNLQATHSPTLQAQFINPTTLTITTTNLKTCVVRWHRLDVEPLFSRAPFTTAVATNVTQVRAEIEQVIQIDDAGNTSVTVPEALRQLPLSVEIVGAGQRQVLNQFAHAFEIRLSQNNGQVQVVHAVTGKPLPTTYVKVYSEDTAGRIAFFKDGYTDLRGRFDYASLGTGSSYGMKRFALFISHDQAGSVVREVLPP